MIDWCRFQSFHRIRGNSSGEVSHFDLLTPIALRKLQAAFAVAALASSTSDAVFIPLLSRSSAAVSVEPAWLRETSAAFRNPLTPEQAEIGLANLSDKIRMLIVE
jgi:hypothetical protein